MSETFALILGSAAVGALISSAVNGFFNWLVKRGELDRQDMEMAFKMAELKHQQLTVTHDWYAKTGRDANVEFLDPLLTVIQYRRGMKEFRETGRWKEGEPWHTTRRV